MISGIDRIQDKTRLDLDMYHNFLPCDLDLEV